MTDPNFESRSPWERPVPHTADEGPAAAPTAGHLDEDDPNTHHRPDVPEPGDIEDTSRTPPSYPPSSAVSQQLPVPLPPVTRPPAGSAYGYPARYSDAPGTGRFQLALPQLGTITAGPAVGSLVVGITALVVVVGVACSGLFAPLITVAVTVLAVFFGSASILLALIAFRQISRGGGEYTGKGVAIAGLSCGGTAISFAALIAVVLIALA